MCVEVNAKNLLLLMKECRDSDAHDMFIPPLFDRAVKKFLKSSDGHY